MFDKKIHESKQILDQIRKCYDNMGDQVSELKTYDELCLKTTGNILTAYQEQRIIMLHSMSNRDRTKYYLTVNTKENELSYDMKASVLVEDVEYKVPDVLISCSSTLSDVAKLAKSNKKIPITSVKKKIWDIFNDKVIYKKEYNKIWLEKKYINLKYESDMEVVVERSDIPTILTITQTAELITLCNYLNIENTINIFFYMFNLMYETTKSNIDDDIESRITNYTIKKQKEAKKRKREIIELIHKDIRDKINKN